MGQSPRWDRANPSLHRPASSITIATGRPSDHTDLGRPTIDGGRVEVDGRPPMLVTLALLMAISTLAVDEPDRTMEGVARFAGTGRPAAGVTLHVIEQTDPRFAVVVDGQGRFHSPAP